MAPSHSRLSLADSIRAQAAQAGKDKNTIAKTMEAVHNKKHFRRLAKTTAERHSARLEWLRQWFETLEQGLGTRRVSPFGEPMTINEWKAFIDWKISIRFQNGRINERLQLGSATNDISSTVAAYKHATGHSLSDQHRGELCAYLSTDTLDEYGLHTEAKEKPIASPDDWRQFVRAAYSADYLWRTPRERLQFIALLMIMAFGVSRPGEAVTSAGYTIDNEALQWTDIQWYLIVKGGRVRTQAVVRMRFLKGKRRKPDYKEFTLRETDDVAFDPTLPLLALALEDGVFGPGVTLQTLYAMSHDTIRKFRGKMPVPTDSSVTSQRVLRASHYVGGKWRTHPTKGQQYDQSLSTLKKIGRKAGCVDNVGWFVFRRMMINMLNTSTVTRTDKKAMAGHNDSSNISDRAYISRLAKVDVQGMMAEGDEAVLDDAAAELRGMMFIDGLPESISAKGRVSVDEHPDIVDLCVEAEQLKIKILSAYPSLSLARQGKSDDCRAYDNQLRRIGVRRRQICNELYTAECREFTSNLLRDAFKEAMSRVDGEVEGDNPDDTDDDDLADVEGETEDEWADRTCEAGLGPAAAAAASSTSAPLRSELLAESSDVPMLVRDPRALRLDELARSIRPPLSSRENLVERLADAVFTKDPAVADPAATILSRVELVDLMRTAQHPDHVADRYPGEDLTAEGTCPICGLGWEDKKHTGQQALHVHACFRKELASRYAAAFANVAGMANGDGNSNDADPSAATVLTCPLSTCNKTGFVTVESLAVHLHSHSTNKHCRIAVPPSEEPPKGDNDSHENGGRVDNENFNESTGMICTHTFTTFEPFVSHLETAHGLLVLPTIDSLPQSIDYCTGCSVWLVGRKCIQQHSESHVDDLLSATQQDPTALGYSGQGRDTAPLACPFCLTEPGLPEHERGRRFVNRAVQLKHIASHIIDLHTATPETHVPCPFDTCSSTFLPADLADHLIVVHTLRIAGVRGAGSNSAALTTGDLSKLKLNGASKRRLEQDEPQSLGESLAAMSSDSLRSLCRQHRLPVYVRKAKDGTSGTTPRAKPKSDLLAALEELASQHGGALPTITADSDGDEADDDDTSAPATTGLSRRQQRGIKAATAAADPPAPGTKAWYRAQPVKTLQDICRSKGLKTSTDDCKSQASRKVLVDRLLKYDETMAVSVQQPWGSLAESSTNSMPHACPSTVQSGSHQVNDHTTFPLFSELEAPQLASYPHSPYLPCYPTPSGLDLDMLNPAAGPSIRRSANDTASPLSPWDGSAYNTPDMGAFESSRSPSELPWTPFESTIPLCSPGPTVPESSLAPGPFDLPMLLPAAAAAAGEAAASSSATEPSREDLFKMTAAQLRALCKERNIKVISDTTGSFAPRQVLVERLVSYHLTVPGAVGSKQWYVDNYTVADLRILCQSNGLPTGGSVPSVFADRLVAFFQPKTAAPPFGSRESFLDKSLLELRTLCTKYDVKQAMPDRKKSANRADLIDKLTNHFNRPPPPPAPDFGSSGYFATKSSRELHSLCKTYRVKLTGDGRKNLARRSVLVDRLVQFCLDNPSAPTPAPASPPLNPPVAPARPSRPWDPSLSTTTGPAGPWDPSASTS